MDTTEEQLKKKHFAAELLLIDISNRNEVFAAALKVFPNDYGAALRICDTWVEDAEVVAERIALIQSGAGFDDRDKIRQELINELMKIVRTGLFAEDRIKAAKEVANIAGINQENKVTINNNVQNNITSNKVMIVKDHGTDEAWEAKLMKQQEELTNASASRTIN